MLRFPSENIGQILFRKMVNFLRRYPVKEQVLFFTVRKDGELEGNAKALYPYVKGKKVICAKRLPHNPFTKLYMYYKNITSRVIVTDDYNRYLRHFQLRQSQRVVQLWHACGAFKKFGMSTAELIFGDNRKSLEKYPNYGNLSYVTVSSPEVIWAYEEAMNLKDTKTQVVATGVSRTDVFYDQHFIAQSKAAVYSVCPAAENKKIILYAPTFRGRVAKAESPDCLDIPAMKRALGDEYVLLIKHHPFVKQPPVVPEDCADFAMDVTKSLEIDQLLCASDVCVSDYSSLIFEYSLFERPMIFFAYDLDDYFDWRGFYYNYDELTPGPVVKETEEIIDYIRHLDARFDQAQVHAFKEKFMSSCDGHATDRIMALVYAETRNKRK